MFSNLRTRILEGEIAILPQLMTELDEFPEVSNSCREELFVTALRQTYDNPYLHELVYELISRFEPTGLSVLECLAHHRLLEDLLRRVDWSIGHFKNYFYPNMSSASLEVLLGFGYVDIWETRPYCEILNEARGSIYTYPIESVILDYVLCASDNKDETRRLVSILRNFDSPPARREVIRSAIVADISNNLWDEYAPQLIDDRLFEVEDLI